MRKINILLCMLALAASCTAIDEQTDNHNGNPDIGITPEGGNSELIDEELFDVINLDYPGLEDVRKYHEEGDEYRAASSLLKYFRNRSSVSNPNVNLIDNSLTSAARNIADQAMDYRFYVRNYKESSEGGLDKYWSFKKDDKIDWTFTPQGADKEFSIQKHRHQWMIYQAKAYWATKDEKYIDSWIEVYKDWWKTYPYKEGSINYDESMSGSLPAKEVDYGRAWSGLQPAERLLDQLDIFTYVIQAQHFTQEWLAEFLVMMHQTAENIKANPVREENSNVRLAQDQALATVGILMPEFKNAPAWLEHGATEITRHLNNQFNEDGVQNELDPGYHMGVIGNFLKIYDAAKRNRNLDKFPADYVSKLRKACNFMADVIWPDYSIDFFNDTRAMSSRVLLRNMRTYHSMFPEEKELAWMASEGTTEEPESRVKIYDKSGWYMMMNGWKKTSLKLIHKNNYNPYNRWHCQHDNGTVSIYKDGRCFTPDPGTYSYGGTSQSNADRKAFAAASIHNTVTRNGADIPRDHAKGRFLKQESTPEYELIVTENQSYSDFTHRRAIFMVEGKFYVIADEAFGPAKDVDAVLNFSLCTDEKDKKINVVQTDDMSDKFIYGVHTEFRDRNNMLFRTFTDCTDGYTTETNTGYYSPNIGVKVQRKRYKVSVRKNENQEARFITVILPFSDPSEIRDMKLSATYKNASSNTPAGAELEVKVGEKVYTLKYSLY